MESKCHKQVKSFICAGKDGTEFSLPSRKRIDCRLPNSKVCYEVELNKARLSTAIKRLVEGLETKHCNRGNLVTKEGLMPEAQRLIGNKKVEIVSLSEVNKFLKFT